MWCVVCSIRNGEAFKVRGPYTLMHQAADVAEQLSTELLDTELACMMDDLWWTDGYKDIRILPITE